MHEFHADGAAIAGAQYGEDFPHRGGFPAQHEIDENWPIQIGVGEAVGGWVQFRMWLWHLQAQRVQAGFQVAAHAVAADQHQGADGIQRAGAQLVG